MNKFLSFLLFIIVVFFSHSAITQTQNSSPSITLNHVALHVKELKKSGEFYSDVLQLREIPEPFKDGKHIWYSIGPGSHLHLIEREEGPVVPGKTTHLCFSVKSMDTFISNLDAHNIEYTNWPGTAKEPTTRVDGVKQIYFQDPDGYWIEVNDDFK